ncbi:MAG: hypothetical protein GX130_03240 [Candidatus Hydrogenedens sp.]|jgi:hypothetical protein|nr:hypothetical protein [Candidatus Hydrogenedens sp.]
MRKVLVLSLLLGISFVNVAYSVESWHFCVLPERASEESVRLALEDLLQSAEELGQPLVMVENAETVSGNVIILSYAPQHPLIAKMISEGLWKPAVPENTEGYEIVTVQDGNRKIMVIAGASAIGDAYGIYWLRDRMRVFHQIPEINAVREPEFPIRLAGAWGRRGYGGSTKEQMRGALRNSINWVSGPNVLDLIPWSAEPEATENADHREKARELIAYAHSLGMKYFSFSNAYVYHPSILEEFDATLNPEDPKFWDAVQETYRRLFQALPELDGIELCNDDLSGFWGNYLPFDVMREAPECDWSYTKRYNTFMQKVQEVVNGEFGKQHFYFTWGLREHEIHCQPEVFKEIFKDNIPTDNLYLMPKITRGDRWWHQPYNATFNLTPHKTLVLFETMNYYEGGISKLFPTFSGQYFQRGLQRFLAPEDSNVEGIGLLAGPMRDGWGTVNAYSYVLYRLTWDLNESMEQIARDFASIYFGPAAAESMAAVYLASPAAYKYGLHIEPISYGQFNSFPHMRVNTFPAEGYPALDSGKEHMENLYKIYLRCEPWSEATLRAQYYGLEQAEQMIKDFESGRDKIEDAAVAEDVGNRLMMTRNLIRTNIGYVTTIFAYFDYKAQDTKANKKALAEALHQLEEAREDFKNTPGFAYQLFAIDILFDNAKDMLDNREEAIRVYNEIPTRSQLDAQIKKEQDGYRQALKDHKDKAVRFAKFELLCDGQDLVIIQDDQFSIKNLYYDGVSVRLAEFLEPLPKRPVKVIIDDLESRPMHPFILEQPSAENDYTLKVYLDDQPGGNGWMIFDLYYLEEE